MGDTVSILTPCFNAMPYLPQALDSALAQTHPAVQIVVVDDGCADGSVACVRDYQRRFPHAGIELVQRPNGGEVPARNTGLEAIHRAGKVEWVAMLDADDWWEPTKLAKQLAAARAAGAACVLVHTSTVAEYPPGMSAPAPTPGGNPHVRAGVQRVGWCLEKLLEPGSIGHPSIMVRRDALAKINNYDPDFPHACDVNLYFHLAVLGTFAYVDEPLVHYRIHPRQTSFNFKLDQIRYQCKVVTDFFVKHPDWEARIGRAKIERELARFVELKLESLYWRRRLGDFRDLLRFAAEQGMDGPALAAWRRKARVPDWAILLKDRLTAGKARA